MPVSVETKKIGGYVLTVIGFLMVLLNAVNYIFGLKLDVPSSAIGIVLLAVGIGIVKKLRLPKE
ncbi:MAG TPA: hypothetical protein VN514_05075 [Ignavibacteria bacterium]|nr:hypothetical protein [Ignavibacteria bacterium]